MMLYKKALKNNPNSPQVPNHPYIKLIIEGSGFGKKNHYLI